MAVGDIVHYKLSAEDVTAIEATGRHTTKRQPLVEGDVLPAVVIRDYMAEQNLQVFLDGEGTYWAPARAQGTAHGQWSPKR